MSKPSVSMINPRLLSPKKLGAILEEVPEDLCSFGFNPHAGQIQAAVKPISKWVAKRLKEKHPKAKDVDATARFIETVGNCSSSGLGKVIIFDELSILGRPVINPDLDLETLATRYGYTLPGKKSN